MYSYRNKKHFNFWKIFQILIKDWAISFIDMANINLDSCLRYPMELILHFDFSVVDIIRCVNQKCGTGVSTHYNHIWVQCWNWHQYKEGGNPGHHEPLLCRHKPPRFARQTEPPLCRPNLRYADLAFVMQQWTSIHHTEQLFLNLGFYV